MKPQPAHLGPEYGSQFSDESVVSAYRLRPPYPVETIRVLRELAAEPDALLDVGCGPGSLTLPLAPHFSRVDAVDPSRGMLRAARSAAGGEHAHIRWIESTLADAPLEGPYGLITAGQSLHWTDWSRAFPLLRSLLAPGARLAIVNIRFAPVPWEAQTREIARRHSTNREYRPYDPVEEIVSRGLFELEGRHDSALLPLESSVEDHVESFHSANGFSRDRMSAASARAFDGEIRDLLAAHCPDGRVRQAYGARIEYGLPLAR